MNFLHLPTILLAKHRVHKANLLINTSIHYLTLPSQYSGLNVDDSTLTQKTVIAMISVNYNLKQYVLI